MENQETKPQYDVSAHGIHGTTVKLRTFFLFGAFTFVSGFFLGGVILPYLRFKPPIEDLQKAQPNPVRDAILVAIGPQTVWASPAEGQTPVSTNLSVEQLVSDYQVLAEQKGYETQIEYANTGDNVEIRFAFKEPEKELQNKTFRPAPNKDFYKTLILGFEKGTSNGSIILSKMRKDGEELTKGAAFVDLINFGTKEPELAVGQYLTTRGIFEIKSNENGAIATIDGQQVFPVLEKSGLKIAFDNKPKEPMTPTEGSPQILRLIGVQSGIPTFKERFILVSSNIDAAPCTSQAIIVDVPRNKVSIVPNMLQTANVVIGNGKKVFTLSGFCEKETKNNKNTKFRTEASYNLMSGELSLNHLPNTAPISNDASLTANPQVAGGNWRQTSPTRIASPYGAAGALVSISCRPSGGISIGVSGLPAPADGKAAKIIFDSSSGSATGGMNWLESGKTYEINSGTHPIEARQIINVLRANGTIMINGAGGKKIVNAAGAAQIDGLLKNCTISQPNTTSPPTKPIIAQQVQQNL